MFYNEYMLRRLFLVLTLVTAFALGQQGAAVHAISHIADEQEQSQQQKHLPHSQSCEKCAAYAQLGSAVGVEHQLLLSKAEQQIIAPEHGAHHASLHTSPYAARAPPFLS